jgi:hypothetical protein
MSQMPEAISSLARVKGSLQVEAHPPCMDGSLPRSRVSSSCDTGALNVWVLCGASPSTIFMSGRSLWTSTEGAGPVVLKDANPRDN